MADADKNEDQTDQTEDQNGLSLKRTFFEFRQRSRVAFVLSRSDYRPVLGHKLEEGDHGVRRHFGQGTSIRQPLSRVLSSKNTRTRPCTAWSCGGRPSQN